MVYYGLLGVRVDYCSIDIHRPSESNRKLDPFWNGKRTTYKNGDDWGMVYCCFNH